MLQEAGRLDEVLAEAAARREPLPAPEVRRALRVARGLTQADVAALLSIDRASVARYELGIREPRGELRKAYRKMLRALANGAGE